MGSEGERKRRMDCWSSALRAVIERHHAMPYRWGLSDCALLVGDAIHAITGDRVLSGYRWGSRRGAIFALQAAGCASAIEFFTRDRAEIKPEFAMRGDLGIVAGQHDPLMSPAIIDGPYAFSKNEAGPVVLPRSAITRAWAI